MAKYNYQRLISFLNNQTDVNVKITYIQMKELLEKNYRNQPTNIKHIFLIVIHISYQLFGLT